MIKNLVFDLGNVVLILDWNSVLDKYADNEEDKKLLNQATFESEEWIKLDDGAIEKAEAIKNMKSHLPERLHNACEGIMEHWKSGLVINDKIINFIDTSKEKGYNIYVLSNAPLDIPEYIENIGLEAKLDGKIISAEERLSKPNHKIYELLLNRYNLNAEECLFMDDRKENIEAARECKLNGYVFNYKEFDKFLVDIKNEYNID